MSDSQKELNLEIGSGETPLIGMLRDDLRGSGPAILLDYDIDSLETVNTNISIGMNVAGENAFRKMIPVQGNIKNIPLDQNSCQTTLAINVLGRIEGDVSPQELAKELYKKTRTAGKVIIVETYTTDVVPENKTMKIFEETGFKLIEKHRNQDVASIFSNEGKTHPFVTATLAGSAVGNYALIFQK